MKTHTKSDIHIQLCEAEVAAALALQEWSIVQQLQQIGDQEKLNNRMVLQPLIIAPIFSLVTMFPTQPILTNSLM